MKIMLPLACILPVLLTAHPVAAKTDRARWQEQAARVTIQRDDWGIAHVHGRSDADAVFGMIYAQAEDDFNRIEANYLTALGRTARIRPTACACAAMPSTRKGPPRRRSLGQRCRCSLSATPLR